MSAACYACGRSLPPRPLDASGAEPVCTWATDDVQKSHGAVRAPADVPRIGARVAELRRRRAPLLESEPMMDLDRCLFLDTETGGLNPEVHPLLSVGVVDGAGERLADFFVLDACLHLATDEALAVNRISLAEVNDEGIAPPDAASAITRIVDEKRSQLAQAHAESGAEGDPPRPVIVGHNVGFDVAFIRRLFSMAVGAAATLAVRTCRSADALDQALESARGVHRIPPEFGYRTIDTFSLLSGAAVAGLVPWSAVGSLDAAVDHFGIKMPEGQRHTACGDALACREVVARLLAAGAGRRR